MIGATREQYNRNSSSSNHDSAEDKDGNTTPPPPTETTTRTRIFVGDLGGKVTAEDLRNTFSSLGKVESVEIVRTQARSFAYFDFFPASPKSLSKLFSTYNGCKWKGGRLRLEKAKEHYLLRLRQEWAEDAKLANSKPSNTASKNVGSPEELNNILNPEKMEFRLFFPKLRKVKPLPFKGTGKHKYSFQRVEVPSLPIHFCDCEEHSDRSHATDKGKHFSELEAQGCGLDKEELDMMKSVMNKLFEREYIPNAASEGAGLLQEGENAKSVDNPVSDENETHDMTDNCTKSVDDLVAGESETDNMTDDDNLIINMVAGGAKEIDSLWSWGQEAKVVDELQASIDGPSGHVLKSGGQNIAASDKKRKSPLTEQAHGNKFVFANPSGRKGSAKKAHLHESAQAIGLESSVQPANTNRSRSQKFAWRDLAGERGNSSFSISHIIQSTAPNTEESKSNGVNAPYITEGHNPIMVKDIDLESQSNWIESNWIEKNKELGVAQPAKPNAAVNKSARGASWLQKSSWTQLVSEKNSSFSISQLLPSTTLEKHEQVEPKRTVNSTGTTYGKLVESGISASAKDCSKASGFGNNGILNAPDSSNMVGLDTIALDPEPSPQQKDLQAMGESDETNAVKKNHAMTEQPSVRNFRTGGSCSFMRSAASMREWMKAKAALSGSLKKQSNEK